MVRLLAASAGEGYRGSGKVRRTFGWACALTVDHKGRPLHRSTIKVDRYIDRAGFWGDRGYGYGKTGPLLRQLQSRPRNARLPRSWAARTSAKRSSRRSPTKRCRIEIHENVRGADAFVRPIDLQIAGRHARSRQRFPDGDAADDRCAASRVGVSHHRRDPVLRLREAGQEDQRPRADLGQAAGEPARRRGRGPHRHRRPARGADPGIFRRAGRQSHRELHPAQLHHQHEEAPRSGDRRGLTGCGRFGPSGGVRQETRGVGRRRLQAAASPRRQRSERSRRRSRRARPRSSSTT